MSTSKYRAFAAAAELRNITRAAELLGYTQSGVSHLINALEAELGVTLLIRAKSGTVLTPEGEALLPYVQRVLAAEQDVISKATDLRGLTTGKLRIATFSSVAIHWLPRILARFRECCPGVELSVTNGNYAEVEEALLQNAVDCGFVALPSREEFSVMPLARDRLLAVLSSTDPLADRTTLTPEDMTEKTFIMPAEGLNYSIGKLFSRAGVTLRARLDINDDYAAVAMVRQGLGVTILPELMVRDLPTGGLRWVPIKDSEREIGIAVHRSRCPSPAIRAFLGCVQEILKTQALIPADEKSCAEGPFPRTGSQ